MGKNETEEPTSDAAGALAHAAARRDDFSVQSLMSTSIADGEVMRELRWSLDALAAQFGEGTEPDAKIALNRPHALALLTSLHTGLRELLARPANLQISPEDEDDVEIKFEHPTMSLLLDLIDAFSDLDNAKSHAVFGTSHISRGASLTRSEIRKRDEILALVEAIKVVQNIRTTAAADRKLVEMMRKNSNRSITVKQLNEMRKTRRKQRSRTKS